MFILDFFIRTGGKHENLFQNSKGYLAIYAIKKLIQTIAQADTKI